MVHKTKKTLPVGSGNKTICISESVSVKGVKWERERGERERERERERGRETMQLNDQSYAYKCALNRIKLGWQFITQSTYLVWVL